MNKDNFKNLSIQQMIDKCRELMTQREQLLAKPYRDYLEACYKKS